MHSIPAGTRRRACHRVAWIAAAILLACSGVTTGTRLASVAVVTVSLQPPQIATGGSSQATAVLQDSAGQTLGSRKVTWSTSDAAIATVDQNTGMVRGISAGKTTISATSEGKTGGADVTVTTPAPPNATVATVAVSLGSTTIVVGSTTTASAVLLDSVGQVLTGRSVFWTSANTTVAKVDGSSGIVTALAVGATSIIATCEGKTGSAVITVQPVPVATVTVSLGQASVIAGSSTQATAVLKDAAGNVLAGRSVAWSSTNGNSATVDAVTGNVHGIAAGSADIVATSEGKSGKATLTVVAPAPVATKLAIGTQPSASAVSGEPFGQQPSIQLQDASGTAVAQSGVVVTAAVGSGGGTLVGTSTATTNGGGTAVFSNLAITGSGAQTLRFTAPNLSSATSSPITVSAATTGGTMLFQEDFEDTNLGARGWYDLPSGGITSLSASDHIAGSAHSLQVSFAQGGTSPSPRANGRHLFAPTDAVYVRYWVKHSANWVGSGHTYHPHEFYILSTLDDQYAGPSFNYLTTYIEHNWMSDGGHPVLESQDSRNIDVTRINQDLTTTTENRAVSGCNGSPDNTLEITCYQIGTDWYNGKTWRSAQPAFVDAAGPNYKGDWHKVEAYFKLNSIVNGIGQRDGVAQCWVDGVLYVDLHNLQFRTGAHPTLQFNQLLIAPYIGDGSPVAQTLWYDDLIVMTGPPAP